MCGIAGLVRPGAGADELRRSLDRMRPGIADRGPDGHGRLLEPGVGLLNTRLAIIDVGGGNQPIWNEDETVACVFNGEIYNFVALRERLRARGHRLATSCDTEVLVHLYEDCGARLVEELHGMFAFAVYDARRGRLLIGRDRLGIKPVYLARLADGIAFASSIRSLIDLGVSADPDPAALAEYLRFYKVGEPRTAYAAIRTLLPGHYLTIDTTSADADDVRWFDVADLPVASTAPEADEAEEAAHRAFRQAIRTHLVADVEVGAFLSGGVDSSLVVAEAQQATSRPMRTYSIAFLEGERFNEAPWAEKVAGYLGTNHQTLEVRTVGPDLLHEALDACNQPFAVASLLPLLTLAGTASRDLKVVLTGDGGDEIGLGYPWYRWMAGATARRWPRSPPAAGALRVVELAAARVGANSVRRAAKFARGGLLGGAAASDAWRYDLTAHGAHMLLSPEYRQAAEVESLASPTAGAWRDARTPVDALRQADLAVLLRDEMLIKVDRATMASGLEARVPLLDDTLVAAMVAVPSSRHLADPLGKALLRRWLRAAMPGLAVDRPKHGFDVPIQHWLRGDLRPEVERLLLAPSRPGLTDAGAARAVWARAEAGAPGAGHTIYAMLVAELWLERGTAT